jgi:hypothetical protein
MPDQEHRAGAIVPINNDEASRASREDRGEGPNLPFRADNSKPIGPSLEAEHRPPPEIPSLDQQLRERDAELYAKVHPVAKHGWGRFGQVMGRIGSDAVDAAFPNVMPNIPGTREQAGHELYNIRDQLQREEALGIERERAGLPKLTQLQRWGDMPDGTRVTQIGVETPGRGVRFEEPGPHMLERMPETPEKPAAQPTPGTMPPIPQELTPGIPKQIAQAPQFIAPPVPQKKQQPTQWNYGAPTAGQRQMSQQEIAQENAANQEYWNRLEQTKPFPDTITLKPGATENDAVRVQGMLKNMESAGRLRSNDEFNHQMAEDRKQREEEAQALRQQAADEKMVHAVDNHNRVHYMSQGDYNAHQADFHPHPFTLAPGEYQKALESATRVNEMQARMNGMAEAAREFNWKDSGQLSIVSQLVNTLNGPSWFGRTVGIDPFKWLNEQFMTKPGAEGATPETRNYIANLLSLREAMLALPKEITEGSRMTEQGVGALYATLPAGWTPNYAWAITQLRLTQAILDRDRGTKVPIIDGMREDKKTPLLYRFSATTKDGKHQFFSDDKREWIDENGDRVERPR